MFSNVMKPFCCSRSLKWPNPIPSNQPAKLDVFDAFESRVMHDPEYWLLRCDGMWEAFVLKQRNSVNLVFISRRLKT